MTLCLSCWRASPSGSRYCGGCGLGLGVRICEEGGHTNLLSAQVCRVCGGTELSDGVWAMSLVPLSRLLMIAVAVALWKFLIFPNAGEIARMASIGTLSLAAFLTNRTVPAVVRGLQVFGTLLISPWCLGLFLYFLPERGGATGRLLRSLPLALLRWTIVFAFPRMLRALGNGLGRLLFAPMRKPFDAENSPHSWWGGYDPTYRNRRGGP